LSTNSAQENVPPLVLLQAYGQIMLAHPEYRPRYWAVAAQLQTAEPENAYVLEALADRASQQHTANGAADAIRYLDAAIQRGSTNAADFEQLAKLLIASHRQAEALSILRQGTELFPFDSEIYRLNAQLDFSLNKDQEGCELVQKATHNFPQDDVMRDLGKRCTVGANGKR